METDNKKRIFVPSIEELDISADEKKKLLAEIKSIIATHTLSDEEWTKAISAQNFLVDLAFELDMTRDRSFETLLNAFLGSFSPQFDGGYRMNERNILIIPDENQKLINCMIKEDEIDSFYSGPLSASKITNPDKIYQNYLYGIMVNIAAAANNAALTNVFNHCIKELFHDDSLDKERGGWVHYRLPWITARIVLGLQNVLNNNRIWLQSDLYEKIASQVRIALKSLINRIYQNKYWRSGAGEWVSKWESTGLCLEAFISSKEWSADAYFIEPIDSVIKYLFTSDVMMEWMPNDIDFSTEESTNKLLAQIVLSSVLYRYLKFEKWKDFSHHRKEIGNFFIKCINTLTSTDKISVRQFCTMPQILLYIVKAIRS